MPEQELPDISATMAQAWDDAQDTSPVEAEEVRPQPEESQQASDSEQGEGETTIDPSGEQEVEQPEDSPVSVEPPARWSAEDKETFSALPREAQELVLKREHDVESHLTRRTQEIAETAKRYETLEQILEPRRQAFAMDGLDEASAVRQLFALSDYASRDPSGFVHWFAQQRGIELGASKPSEEDDYSDPEISALQKELAQIKGELQSSRDQQIQEQQQRYNQEVNEFEHAKDEKGVSAHPHFQAVRGHMGALLQSGAAKDLRDAYEQAVWANPQTRSKLIEAQTKASEAQRISQAKAKAAAAEKAASSRPRAANGQFVEAPKSSIEDTLSSVYDQLNG